MYGEACLQHIMNRLCICVHGLTKHANWVETNTEDFNDDIFGNRGDDDNDSTADSDSYVTDDELEVISCLCRLLKMQLQKHFKTNKQDTKHFKNQLLIKDHTRYFCTLSCL
jgi:hypothetical protein